MKFIYFLLSFVATIGVTTTTAQQVRDKHAEQLYEIADIVYAQAKKWSANGIDVADPKNTRLLEDFLYGNEQLQLKKQALFGFANKPTLLENGVGESEPMKLLKNTPVPLLAIDALAADTALYSDFIAKAWTRKDEVSRKYLPPLANTQTKNQKDEASRALLEKWVQEYYQQLEKGGDSIRGQIFENTYGKMTLEPLIGKWVQNKINTLGALTKTQMQPVYIAMALVKYYTQTGFANQLVAVWNTKQSLFVSTLAVLERKLAGYAGPKTPPSSASVAYADAMTAGYHLAAELAMLAETITTSAANARFDLDCRLHKDCIDPRTGSDQ